MKGANLNKHGSRPYNPDIANVFFRAGEIEAWGRGIERMMNACEEYGCEMPQYRYDGTCLWVVFKFKETSQKTSQKLPLDQAKGCLNLTEQQNEIIKYLEEHPYVTRTELIECIKTGKSGGIRYNLSILKELGLLKRVGGRKYGHWEILSRNND